ncbi:MAG: hypothetical protein ABI556_14685, partial [Gemmatimonadales bacterium]
MRNLPTTVGGGSHALRLPPDPLDTSFAVPTTGTEFAGISEYIAMAKRRWLLIILVALVCTGYTFNSVRNERAQYKSRATVRLVDPSRAIAGDMAGSMSPQMPFSNQTNPISSQQEIVMSEAVATIAVDLKGLRLVAAPGMTFPQQITYATVSDSSPARLVNMSFQPTTFVVSSGNRSATAAYGSQAEVDGVRLIVASRPKVPATTFNVISKESAISQIASKLRVPSRA